MSFTAKKKLYSFFFLCLCVVRFPLNFTSTLEINWEEEICIGWGLKEVMLNSKSRLK